MAQWHLENPLHGVRVVLELLQDRVEAVPSVLGLPETMVRTSEQQETQEIARCVSCCLCLGEHVLTQGTCRGKIARLLVQPGHRELQ